MAGSSPRPSRVLIVDDDPFAGLVLSGLFSSALEAVENSSVDLVESKSEVLEAVKAAVLAGAPLDLVRTDTRAHSITCKHAARYHERRDNSSDTLRDKRNTRLYSRTFLSLSLSCVAQLLLDWELEAGVTGLDVARAIKEETTSSPRMVIVSGNERAATLSDAERAEMEGLGLTANEWLVKPCTAAQVGRLLSPAA